MSRSQIGAVAAVVLAGLAAPAAAHHSFAMFEREKTLTIEGAITEFHFTNPHAWIHVRTAAGKEWAIEAGSPNMMRRQGWRTDTIKIGEKVGAVLRPMRDGSPAGSLVSLTLKDGSILGPGGAPVPTEGNAPRPK